ncbi:uncharacterized protein Bfra_009014 [Botrytis fragariae]|uniref:Uncharacterized protein n=1 Tax=Botrytis fragariae TaxID=1964551 RepID=A0A8H6AQX9_9HELO|nr:uncharacterized protein Bfra_009014 [Botrytis fragariae]KAF5871987.1 hypothetical protein Bfra_009014 [Botrytis fragariae]
MDHGDLPLPYLGVSRIFLTSGLRVRESLCTYFRFRTGLLDTSCNMCKILRFSPIFIAYATMMLKDGAQQARLSVRIIIVITVFLPRSFRLRLAGACTWEYVASHVMSLGEAEFMLPYPDSKTTSGNIENRKCQSSSRIFFVAGQSRYLEWKIDVA